MMPSEYPKVDLSPIGIELSFCPHDGTWIISSFPSTHHLLLQSCSQSFSLLSRITHGLQPALATSLRQMNPAHIPRSQWDLMISCHRLLCFTLRIHPDRVLSRKELTVRSGSASSTGSSHPTPRQASWPLFLQFSPPGTPSLVFSTQSVPSPKTPLTSFLVWEGFPVEPNQTGLLIPMNSYKPR